MRCASMQSHERGNDMRSGRARVSRKVSVWNRRARLRGLPHDLTAAQWEESLAFFGYTCAYCGGFSQTMDHYFPLGIPCDAPLAGTTVGNCIPCCVFCNRQKGFTHPEHLPSFFEKNRLAVIAQFV